MSDIVLNKIQTIKRCLNRINEEFLDDESEFKENYTKQDSIILNLERASQATIDIAMHVIKSRNLGLPNSNRDAFDMLYQAKYISKKIQNSMKSMIGFRNLAVHDYQNLNIEIVISIVKNHLSDYEKFIDEISENFFS